MNSVITLPNTTSNVAPGFAAKAEEAGQVDPEIVRLRAKHDLWTVYAPEWNLYVAAYEGGPEFATGANLFRHQRENPEDFDDRCRRVHYFNYCEPLVEFFTNFIFSDTIQRNGGNDDTAYQEFIADVNKKGDSVSDYMKMVSDDSQIYGMSYTLVDTPKNPVPDGEVLTKQMEDDLNLKPYWVLIKPDEIIDWVVDEFDRITYAKRLVIVTERTAGAYRVLERYCEWFLDRTIITDVDVTDRHQPVLAGPPTVTPNTLGIIPLHCVRYKRSKRYPYMGNSFLRDFAYNNREVMNLTSLIQEFLYRQCFNLMAKEADTGIPMRDQQDGVVGSSNVIEYPKGGHAPAYISPPIDPAEFLQNERQRIVNEMYKRAAQDTVKEAANGNSSSGFSQAQSFSKTVPFIATRADTLEKAENALMDLTMKMLGKKWTGKIKYKDRYEMTNITDAITQLTMVFRDLLMPSETFVKEELKLLVAEMDGKITPDKMAKILSEIESMDFSKYQDTQKQALIGKTGTSPAAQQKPKQTGTMAEVSKEATGKTGATSKTKPPKQK